MSEILEREEGLFTRHGATRALCIIVLLGWLVGSAIGLLALVVFFLAPNEVQIQSATRVVVPCVLFMIAAGAAVSVLRTWRKCDRCRRHLFYEGRRSSLSSRSINKPWMRQFSWMQMAAEPERDYRAHTLLGSYFTAAVVSMALKGRLRCQWCGHEDGVKPDYVVTSQP